MNQIKKTADYTIFQKRSGRYAVKDKDKKWVNADEKAKILLAEGLIKKTEPKPAEPEETAIPEAEGEESSAAAGGEESTA